MKKQILLYVYLLCTQVNISHCMLSKWKFKPCTQRENSKAFKKRQLPVEKLVSNKTVTLYSLHKDEEALDDGYRCFQHAIARTTGFRKANNPEYDFLKLHFRSGNNLYTSINVEDYFEQTRFPQKHDLVVYTNSRNDFTIQHFGVVVSKTRIESKWGTNQFIARHTLFGGIPDHYGTAAGFFTLKEEYKTDEGKKLLLQSIESDILRGYWVWFVVVPCLRELIIYNMRINPHICK